MKSLSPLFLFLLFSHTVQAQVCTDKVANDAAENLKNLSKMNCKGLEFKIIISQKDKDLPFKTVSVKIQDLQNRLKLGAPNSTSLKFDGVSVPNSQVTIYSPACSDAVGGYKHFFYQPSCKNDLNDIYPRSFPPGRTSEEFLQSLEMVLNPIIKKSKKLCLERVNSSLEEKIKEYVKTSGGQLLSIKNSKPFINLWGPSNNTQFQTMNIEVLKNGTKSTLQLMYALNDSSQIQYHDSPTNAFGEYVKYSERVAKVKVAINAEKYEWDNGNPKLGINGSEAVLTNTSTNIQISKFDIPNLPCVEEFNFNQDDIASFANDDTGRGNSKANIAPVPATGLELNSSLKTKQE